MPTLTLADDPTGDDLRTFLQRLLRAGEPEVRLVTQDKVLAVYGCTRAPQGITDPASVVLVMRGFALAEEPEEACDVTVQGRALLDRIPRLGSGGLRLPEVTALAPWAGVLPPVSGWQRLGSVDAASLQTVASEGIARVSAALPEQPGEAIVQKVRNEVWGAEIAPGLPAAAAFAAEAMGFLGESPLSIARSRTWTRLSSGQGHVLIR